VSDYSRRRFVFSEWFTQFELRVTGLRISSLMRQNYMIFFRGGGGGAAADINRQRAPQIDVEAGRGIGPGGHRGIEDRGKKYQFF